MENSQLKRSPRQDESIKKKADRPGPGLVAEEQKAALPKKTLEGNTKTKVKKETSVKAIDANQGRDIYQKHGEPRAAPQKEIDQLRMKGQGKSLQQKTKQKLSSKEEAPTKQVLTNQPARMVPTITQRNQARLGANEGATIPIKVPGKYRQSDASRIGAGPREEK